VTLDAAPWSAPPTPRAASAPLIYAVIWPQVPVRQDDWADVTGLGIGVFGRVDYAVEPKIAVTGSIGYVAHLSKETDVGIGTVETSTSELSVLGGARFTLAPNVDVHALTGINIWTGKVEDESNSENRIPLILGGGYALPSGLTLGGDLFIPNLLGNDDGEDVELGLMLKVGYMVMP
jgi:hypothetical protein